MAEEPNEGLKRLVANVAAAYFASSHVSPPDIPSVIDQIASSLRAVGASAHASPSEAVATRKLTPQQIRKSIRPDALISFEDGKGYKTLRRHLAVRNLTPEQYREKWGLPKDYPITAPSYSAARSQMAKQFGLGNKKGGAGPSKASAARRRKAAPAKAE